MTTLAPQPSVSSMIVAIAGMEGQVHIGDQMRGVPHRGQPLVVGCFGRQDLRSAMLQG